MIQYLLEVSLCSIAFISFYYLALRNKKFHDWNRFFLIGSLVISFLIPLLHIPIEEIIYVPKITSTTVQSKVVTDVMFSWQAIIFGIYLTGSSILLFLFFKELFEISRIIKEADKETFPNYSLVKLEQEFPLCSFFNFIICDKDTSISKYELNHELSHINQKHSYDKVFVELVKVVLWFNPAVYLYQKNIHAVHEFLADESVINFHSSDSYQHFLIQSLTKQHPELSTVNPFHSLIKNRLHMLNNKKESTKHIFLLAIPIIACLTFFISCEKTTKVIALEDTEPTTLHYTKHGLITLSDTIIIFDDQTFEEEVRIVSRDVTPEEYEEIQKNKARNIEDILNKVDQISSSDVLNNVDLDDRSVMVTVVDTIVIFNAETNEESTHYHEQKMTLEEYNERPEVQKELRSQGGDLYGKAGDWSDGSEFREINIGAQRSISNLITVIDTIVIFNDDTYEEEIRTVETKMTLEAFEERKAKYERQED